MFYYQFNFEGMKLKFEKVYLLKHIKYIKLYA